MVSLDVVDLGFRCRLAQTFEPAVESVDLLVEVVLPPRVSPVLGESVEVRHVTVEDDPAGFILVNKLEDFIVPLAALEWHVRIV